MLGKYGIMMFKLGKYGIAPFDNLIGGSSLEQM